MIPTENDSEIRTVKGLPNEDNRINLKPLSSPIWRNTCQIEDNQSSSFLVSTVKTVHFPRKFDHQSKIHQEVQESGSQNLKMKLKPLKPT